MVSRACAALVAGLLLSTGAQAQDVQILTEVSRIPVNSVAGPPNHAQAPVGGGRDLIVALYFIPALKTTFAGCLLSNPGANGYEILPPFRHWYSDVPTDVVERSQSLEGVLAAEGGFPKFIRRLTAHGDECQMDASGFTAANTPKATTTRQLGDALKAWKQTPVNGWPSLYLFWPAPSPPPI